MVNINLWPFGTMKYTGTTASDDLFGTNFLFARDGAWTPGAISQPYQAFASEVGLSTMRYPGGTMTEDLFDMENPNNTGNPVAGQKGLVPLTSFLEFAGSINASATIVIPTYRLFTNTFDASGKRIIDPNAESIVNNFVLFALEEAKAAETSIVAFELGNEWWVNNESLFGFRMSPVDYGRMANFLARTIQEAIIEYNLGQPKWNKEDPEIVIQVGPGGNAEWYSRAELGLPTAGKPADITATEAIFNQISDPVSQSAIDGILTHRYLHGGDHAVTGWAYRPFEYWEHLARNTPGFNTNVSRYVTEWNVSARNENQFGLRQFDSMILLTQEMMNAGVSHANVWAVQQNNDTKLTYNTGLREAQYAGLTFGGLAFDMMAAQLPGQQTIFNPGTISDLQSAMFGSESRIVYFLTNKTGNIRNDVISKFTIPAGTEHVSIYEVEEGSDGKPTVTVRTSSLQNLPSQVQLTLSTDETVMIVLTLGANGATVEGYDRADILLGTVGPDHMSGGLQNDSIAGYYGSDTILGDEGSDTLLGGEGSDVLEGGSGDDLVLGGDGNDSIGWSSGSDTIVGGSGEDMLNFSRMTLSVSIDLQDHFVSIPATGVTISEFESLILGSGNDTLFGGVGRNRIEAGWGNDYLDGREGEDTLEGGDGDDTVLGGAGEDLLDGGSGNDELYGGDGADYMVSGDGHDSIFGGMGDDILESGTGDDLVIGGDGADVLMGNSGDDTMLGGSGDDRALGGLGCDVILLGIGDDYSDGGGGDDFMFGGTGSDSLRGMSGDDFVLGGSQLSLDFWSALFGTSTNLEEYVASIMSDPEDKASYPSDDRMIGGQGNDTLVGGAGNDLILGEMDDDWIIGGGGGDLLSGGFGSDTFIFDLTAFHQATIVDFHAFDDRIILVGLMPLGMGSISEFIDHSASVSSEGVVVNLLGGSEILFLGRKSIDFLHSTLDYW